MKTVTHPCTECGKPVSMEVEDSRYDFYMGIRFVCYPCGEVLKEEAKKQPPPETVKLSDLYPPAMNPSDESVVFGRNR